MSEWYDMSDADLAKDEEAREAKRLAYRNVFYGDEEGRQVMVDLRRQCYADRGSSDKTMTLVGFFESIRDSCGITENKEKDVIDAESELV